MRDYPLTRAARACASCRFDKEIGCPTCHDSPFFRYEKVKEAFKGCCVMKHGRSGNEWSYVGDIDHIWIHICNVSYSSFFCEMCATNVLVTGSLENLKMEVTYPDRLLMLQLTQELPSEM